MKDFSLDSMSKTFHYNNYKIKIDIFKMNTEWVFSLNDRVMYQDPESSVCYYGWVKVLNKNKNGNLNSLIINWESSVSILSSEISYEYAIKNLIITKGY